MLKTTISRVAILIGCLMTISGVANADTTVKLRQTSGGQTYDNTTYIKGKRQRTETNNGQMVMVQQCDLRRNLQIMPEAKVYMIQPYDQPASSNAVNTSGTTPSQPGAVKKGGVVTSTVTTRDTGERKQIFGHTARRIITTMATDSSPDACSPLKSKMEIDGWYIDAAFAFSCDAQYTYTPYRPQASGGCQDRYETKQIGTAKKGFPVWEKTTMFGPNGAESFSSINEVIEFSHATLDASLFDVPAGYREVKDFASAFSANTADMSSSSPDTSTTSAPSTKLPNTTGKSAPTELGPKREGVIRIGLVAVKSGTVGEAMNAQNLALAVQNTLTEQLKTSGVEVVAIEATLVTQIEAEAQQKQCDFVIFSNVSHKKGGGGFGSMIGGAASTIGNSVGYGGGTAAVVAANAATSAVSESIKARDEVTLDVRLLAPGASTPTLNKQFKGKAKSAGEDVVTPLTAQAVQAIVSSAKRG